MPLYGVRPQFKYDHDWDGTPPSGSKSRRYKKAAFHRFLRRLTTKEVADQMDDREVLTYKHHPRRHPELGRDHQHRWWSHYWRPAATPFPDGHMGGEWSREWATRKG